jgi:hypothetical protein
MTLSLLAGIVVITFGIFLIGLSGLAFAQTVLAERFFMSFASSARAHYMEQAFRLLIGAALIVLSPAMSQGSVFRVIGWVLVISSVALILLPWRWHQRFARRVLPTLIRHMRLYAVGLFGFGVLLLYGAFSAGFPSAA